MKLAQRESEGEMFYNRLLTGLSTKQLQAFYVLAGILNFSKAAKVINITQSALSQRIKMLEDNLGQILINRGKNNVSLSDAGARLLKYCKLRETYEQELLYGFYNEGADSLIGTIRICGFSSVVRSVIMPIINENIIKNHPGAVCEFKVGEMREIKNFLLKGEVEFIITQFPINLNGVTSIKIGTERNFLIESKNENSFHDIYIDHESGDHFTEHFFACQKKNNKTMFRRSFYHDIYGLIDAVHAGVGRSVVPMHLLNREHECVPVAGYSAIDIPVILSFYDGTMNSRFHRKVIDALVKNAHPYLSQDKAGLLGADLPPPLAVGPYG